MSLELWWSSYQACPLFRNQEDRNSYTQVMRGRQVIKNNRMWKNKWTKQKPGARFAGTQRSTFLWLLCPWGHLDPHPPPLLPCPQLRLQVSFRGHSLILSSRQISPKKPCNSGRAHLDPQTLLNMEERVSFQNEGQRPWTWPQVIARGEDCQDAKELQHLWTPDLVPSWNLNFLTCEREKMGFRKNSSSLFQ